MASNIYETKRCLMSRYNFLEKLFFWWLKDIVCHVKRHDFAISSFGYILTENLSEIVTNNLERKWQEEKSDALADKRQPNLWKAIVKTYYWDFIKFAVFSAGGCIIIILQPQLLRLTMSYFDAKSKMTSLCAYITATLFVVLMLLHVALDCHGEFQLTLIGIRAKIACSSLIYRKMLRLSSTNQQAGTSVMNLLSVDVAKFEFLFYCIPYIAMLPLQMVVTFCLIWQTAGFVPAIVGIALLIIQTLPMKGGAAIKFTVGSMFQVTFELMCFSVLYYKISLKLRAKQAKTTNERISLIKEAVDGMRSVKCNVWELYFEKLVYSARRSEIGDFLKMSYLTSSMWVLATFCHRLCSFIVGVLYTSQYGVIKAEQILPINLHFFNLRNNFIYFFFGARSFVDIHDSVKRIEGFLLLAEINNKTAEHLTNENSSEVITIKNMTASWDDKSDIKTLENIRADFDSKKLYVIVGPEESGKTSLLKAILGELHPIDGEVIVGGTISYASQVPWLFTSSIRDNILFGEIYDEDKYDQVISACALSDDFSQLPNGDKTLVDDKNVTISESQRAKINMARAVYRDADVYLFDDPLLTVDIGTFKVIMDYCINGLLQDKTRIFFTQTMQGLNTADEIILLDRGQIKFVGCLTDFQKNDEYLKFLSDDSLIVHHETRANEIETIVDGSEMDDETNIITSQEYENNTQIESKENDHFIIRQTKKPVHQSYIKAGGSSLLHVVIAINVVFILSVSGFDFQLAAWGQSGNSVSKTVNQTHYPVEKSYSTNAYDPIWISASLIILIIMSAACKNVYLYKFIFNANKAIHDSVFARLIRTPLQFFLANPSERIMNVFSKITDNMDSALSQSLFESVQTSTHAIAILLPIYIVDWRCIFPTLLSLCFYLKISRIYVSCIQKLKKLVCKAKHPVLSFVCSSLDGLTTIHSFNAEKTMRTIFDSLQDRHTIVHFLAVALVQGFSFWMYLITISLFTVILYGSIALRNDDTSAGYVGLALMQLLSVGFLMTSVVGYIVETMSCLTNVRRMLQFTHIENETLIDYSGRASECWPEKGEIEFRQLCLKHVEDDRLILKNLNFVVQQGKKVNIVGPTGSGKSSIVLALCRLAEYDGDVLIDGIDIKKVSLADLRSRISVIPKEPIIFTSTLRKNLDPLNEFDDESLWWALDDVELKHKFQSLDCPINQANNNLSKTHRYLLYFARAILKRNKILVLDEVVDNVDLAAEALIHDIIKNKFDESTVLIISSKLTMTPTASEQVLTIRDGEVVDT